MRRAILATILLIAAFAGGVLLTATRVQGSDMAPSILGGDWVWITPWGDPIPGDVVRLRDPLDPENHILRRVLAVAGQKITYDADTIRVNNRRLRKQSMGDAEPHLVAQETLWAKKPLKGHSWLTRLVAYPATHWAADTVTVPDGHLYLLSDNRDSALDSRWWGTVATTSIEGVVRLRWGPAHTWRTEFEWTVGTEPIRD